MPIVFAQGRSELPKVSGTPCSVWFGLWGPFGWANEPVAIFILSENKHLLGK